MFILGMLAAPLIYMLIWGADEIFKYSIYIIFLVAFFQEC